MQIDQHRLLDVNHEDIDDETLARLAGREPHLFAELYHRYLDRIYHYHLVRTGSVEDAQDLTSQTFLAAVEHIAAYRGQSSFCRWLFSIAGHKLVDYYRRKRSTVSLNSAESWQDPAIPPEEATAIRLRLAQIAQALATLPAEQAEALTLRLWGALGTADVGQIMGKSEAAVKMLVFRGLRTLRELIAVSPELSQ